MKTCRPPARGQLTRFQRQLVIPPGAELEAAAAKLDGCEPVEHRTGENLIRCPAIDTMVVADGIAQVVHLQVGETASVD